MSHLIQYNTNYINTNSDKRYYNILIQYTQYFFAAQSEHEFDYL